MRHKARSYPIDSVRLLWRFFILIVCFGYFPTCLAQRSVFWREKPGNWLMNVGVGTTYYLGDLTEAGNVGHLRLGVAMSAAVAYRYSPHLTFRAEGQVYYIRGSQKNTHLAYNNLSFFSINPDVWAGVQWDFWPEDDRNHVIIPYALAGLGLTYMTPKATYGGRAVSLAPLHTEAIAYNRLPIIVRYGLGVPVVIGERFKWNLEATYTHVLSDYLDDVSTVYPDQKNRTALEVALSDRRLELGQSLNPPGAQRGNSTRRDGYLIVSARLVYILATPSHQNYRRTFHR